MILAYVIAASLAFTPPNSGSVGDPLLVLDQHDYVYPRSRPTERRAADAELYSPHFSREELELSLGNSAVRLDPSTVLVQRVPGRTNCRPVFHVEPRTRRIKRIATVPESMELWSAVKTGSKVVFLMVGDDSARLYSYAGKAARIVATWSTATKNQCSRIEEVAGRSFVFIRPCTRSEPAQATLWEVTPGAAQRRELDEHLDEFSASADGARVALGVWRKGRRIVQVFDGSVLNADERTPPK